MNNGKNPWYNDIQSAKIERQDKNLTENKQAQRNQQLRFQ